MLSTVFSVMLVSHYLLYQHDYREHLRGLQDLVVSQARLIDSLTEHFSNDEQLSSTEVEARVMKLVMEAHHHRSHDVLGSSGEFQLLKSVDGKVFAMMQHSHGDLPQIHGAHAYTDLPIPMEQLLSDQGGSYTGDDSHGHAVLAVYQPALSQPWIVLAKMAVEDVHSEFFESAIYSLLATVVLATLGVMLFYAITGNVVKELEQHRQRLAQQVEHQTADLQQLNTQLEKAELHYRTVADYAYDWEYWRDENGGIAYMSPSCERVSGYQREDFYETPALLDELVVEEDRATWHTHNEESDTGHRGLRDIRFRIRRADGEIRHIEHACIPVLDQDGHFQGYRASNRDITERIKAEQALRKSEEKFLQIFATAQEGIWILDADLETALVNSRLVELLGYDEREMGGRSLLDFVEPDTREEVRENLQRQMRGVSGACDVKFRHSDGTERWTIVNASPLNDDDGQCYGLLSMVTDITERKRYEEQLKELAHYDPLTHLPNRLLMNERLSHAMERARRSKRQVAVIFFDLDRFVNINDSLGHDFGDRLLCAFAERLTSLTRKEDTIARVGGDEFVMVMEDVKNPQSIALVAQKLINAIAAPFSLDEHELYLSVSVGVSMFPRDGEDAATLLKKADTAMYRSKEEGLNTFQFYTEDLSASIFEFMTLENALRQATDNDELILHYQPQLSMKSGYISGFEALVRWQHPSMGLVSPGKFIPLAEETGLIIEIGEWVLRRACRQAQQWLDEDVEFGHVSVNVSPLQMQRVDIAALTQQVLAETGLPHQYLELEITESALLANRSQVFEQLNQIKKLGVGLAIDDFGTGYSSLSNLSRLPFSRLKIDRAFVNNITSHPDDAAIARMIIQMGHSLGMKVIAEGVENEEQLRFLQRMGCGEVQGFLFSKPLPVDEVASWLLDNDYTNMMMAGTGQVQPTLLLVDDEPAILHALQRALKHEDYHILTAQDADEAFELMAKHHIQVILSDQRMPTITGIELLSRVKKLYPDTIRMILSGQADMHTVTEAINQGWIFKFLTKPWDNEQLRAILQEAFQFYQSRSISPNSEHERV